MILIETGEQSDRSFDAKVLFAAQLAARGHAVALDDATLPEGLTAADAMRPRAICALWPMRRSTA